MLMNQNGCKTTLSLMFSRCSYTSDFFQIFSRRFIDVPVLVYNLDFHSVFSVQLDFTSIPVPSDPVLTLYSVY